MSESAAPLRIIEETPTYWRVVFDYPPFNIVDAAIFEGRQDLLARMDAISSLRVSYAAPRAILRRRSFAKYWACPSSMAWRTRPATNSGLSPSA
jgi:hypothetical protein